jgi:chromosome segregation protein
VTRRLFRSGESEYRINGARTRLMDIQNLLRLGNVGARSYATIEQGRIDQVLNAKPKERRSLIEDAAGVSGYKHKRRLAELKLEATHANLLRVHDIVTEVERQITSLKRQAAKARRYRRLREELRERESIRLARQALEMDRELTRAREVEAQARDAESEATATLAQLEADLVGSREALESAERELRDVAERQHRCEIEIDRGEGQVRACRERIAESEASSQRQREDADALEERERDACARTESQREELTAVRSEQNRVQEEVTRRQSELERLEAEQKILRDEIEALRSRQFESMSHAADLRNRIRSVEETIERNAARRDHVQADHASTVESSERSAIRAAECETAAAEHEVELERLRVTFRDGEEELREARRRHDAAVEAFAGAREGENSAAAKLASLEDVETRFTGVSDGVKTLLASGAASGIRTHGVVADYVEASREVEGAAECYLEWFLPAVILEDDSDARRAVELLRSSGAGRTALVSRTHPTGAPAVGIAGNGRSSLSAELLRDERVLGRLRDSLKLHSAANGAVAERIGDAVLVDSIESALDLHRRYPGVDYITPDGDVVYVSGVISAGGKRAGDQGLLAHRRRLADVRVEFEAAAARATERQAAMDAGRSDVERLDATVAETRTRLDAAEREGMELRVEVQRRTEEAAQLERRRSVLAEELRGLRAEDDPLAEVLRLAVEEARSAEETHREAELSLRDRMGRHDRGDEELKSRLERAVEMRTRAESGGQRLAAFEQEARVLAERAEEFRSRREQLAGGSVTEAEKARTASELLASTDLELAIRLKERATIAAETTRRDAEIAELREGRTRLDEQTRVARTAVETLREHTREAELSRTRTDAAREHLDTLCLQELELSASEVLASVDSVEDVDLEALEAEVARIKERIERVGPVNMTAIEEFSELEERNTFLTAQRADLDRSIESLKESIRRINRQSRKRFEEAFEAIRRNYQEIYKLLFSGGRADLRLEEGEDVLECGIEILAQPPGKRLTGVHLLSGGEKALSAIALLFAIFRYQPSPFCLLDEVDAALDEANVGRFTRMVAEYAKNTQFLIVTHNKVTMESANLLYGVTMEERGISKLVSLQLQ